MTPPSPSRSLRGDQRVTNPTSASSSSSTFTSLPRPHFAPYRPSISPGGMISTLPPMDVRAPRLPAHPMMDGYGHPSTSIRPRNGHDHQHSSRRDISRYEPYRHASEDKIVLPPPSIALRIPHDPYAPRHTLPSIQPQAPRWDHDERSSRVQLPSLRSLSGGNSPANRPMRPLTSDKYPNPNSPSVHYPQPPHTAYNHPSYRPAYQPYPPRKTHPPPHSRPASPLRVKAEPDLSPPLQAHQKEDYPVPTPPHFSPHAGRNYADARRGSASSIPAGREGKEQVVGQTRRLAHLMSEQKRRESINSGFTELRAVLPSALPTDSKAVILRKALARIQQLERAAGVPPGQNVTHMLESEMPTPSSSRPDWRTQPLRTDDRLTMTSRSSSASQRMDRDGERFGGDASQYGGMGVKQEYDRSPESEMSQARYQGYERDAGGEGEERGIKRVWEDEDELDRESVYSQERPSSRGSR